MTYSSTWSRLFSLDYDDDFKSSFLAWLIIDAIIFLILPLIMNTVSIIISRLLVNVFIFVYTYIYNLYTHDLKIIPISLLIWGRRQLFYCRYSPFYVVIDKWSSKRSKKKNCPLAFSFQVKRTKKILLMFKLHIMESEIIFWLAVMHEYLCDNTRRSFQWV